MPPLPIFPSKRKRTGFSLAKESRGQDDFPTRDCDKLFAQDETVHCARERLCVPCAYKIGCFDVALDNVFTESVPNQRPEQCPRSKTAVRAREGTLGYRCGMKVLTLGDGDLSFSLAVARLLSRKGKDIGKGRLIATSYECRHTVERVYPHFNDTLSELQDLGARVMYEVDATRLSDTLQASEERLPIKFHRIVWNFPCTAICRGQDGQNAAMEENKELVRRFVQGARYLLHRNGEIHMSHKTKPPFNQWKIEEVAIQACEGDPTIEYRGRIVLDKFTFPPYTPRKALDRKSFACHDACVYIFGLANHKDQLHETGDSFLQSIPEGARPEDDHDAVLVPVTREIIAEIRGVHLCNVTKKRTDTSQKKNKKSKRKRI